jgi:hypothetical protein
MTLRQILTTLKNFVGDAVRNLNPATKEEFKSELEKIRSDLWDGIGDTQREYRLLVQKFYMTHKPFGARDTKQDLMEYRQLIVHALAANDVTLFSSTRSQEINSSNASLIDVWGVSFPMQNPQILSQPLKYYCDAFNLLCRDENWNEFRMLYNLPEGAKVYYEYLAKKLFSAINTN